MLHLDALNKWSVVDCRRLYQLPQYLGLRHAVGFHQAPQVGAGATVNPENDLLIHGIARSWSTTFSHVDPPGNKNSRSMMLCAPLPAICSLFPEPTFWLYRVYTKLAKTAIVLHTETQYCL
jgi:hypothetical protein